LIFWNIFCIKKNSKKSNFQEKFCVKKIRVKKPKPFVLKNPKILLKKCCVKNPFFVAQSHG